jgi:hypothetical protein
VIGAEIKGKIKCHNTEHTVVKIVKFRTPGGIICNKSCKHMVDLYTPPM